MFTAGVGRLHFQYSAPTGARSGTGVVSTTAEAGFLVLDAVRFDDGTEAARVWVPLGLVELLWSNEAVSGPVDAPTKGTN